MTRATARGPCRVRYRRRVPELTGEARNRIQDDIDPGPVPVWGPPTEMRAFLRWLEQAVEGRSDAARLADFETYPQFKLMPDSLRRDLEAEGLL